MKPVKFKEHNVVYAENQKEYEPLPALKDGDVIVTCWKLSLSERVRLLLNGKLWLSVMNFNKPLQPLYITTKKSELINK